MKKLFLTSFVFKTGKNEYKEQRLVIAPTLDKAYTKANDSFSNQFPESKLISLVVHPAID